MAREGCRERLLLLPESCGGVQTLLAGQEMRHAGAGDLEAVV